MRDLVIIGAGGFGREVMNLAFEIRNESGRRKWKTSRMYTSKQYKDNPPPDYKHYLVCAIGNQSKRRDVVEELKPAPWTRLMHPSAQVYTGAVGYDIVICHNVVVSVKTIIGNHVHINFACTIGHDVIIGDFVTISPGVHISGNVTIGDEVFIGTGALIREKLTIGKGATIGMGAVVVKDVPAGMTVVGNPAKEMK